jgi:quinol-cytochrome oxidoreductase complex cytochrome b subunit
MSFKKKRRYREKKPKDLNSILAAIPATVSFAFFLLVLFQSVRGDGHVGKLLPAIGMLFLLSSIVEFYYGFKELKKDEYSTWSRRIGVILPIISFLLWGSMFVIGLVM